MKTLTMYQVDAFASQLFTGNPAAVIVQDQWLEDDLMQNIAMENNLAETAFVVPEADDYRIRWFTPLKEVRLCGHATLASAHVMYERLGYSKEKLVFHSLSGPLQVKALEHGYQMDFPADDPQPIDDSDGLIARAIDCTPMEVYKGKDDYLVRIESQAQIDRLSPNYQLIMELEARGVLVTAPGNDLDFVSRCFFPRYGINEDPVTGSAHTLLAPYWANQLGKQSLLGQQRSPRSGLVQCELAGNRVYLSGQAITYMQAQISV